jgi:hypothetical protein
MSAEANDRVMEYVDAKVSEVLKEVKAVSDKVDHYLDSKSSETLSLVKEIKAAVTTNAPEAKSSSK